MSQLIVHIAWGFYSPCTRAWRAFFILMRSASATNSNACAPRQTQCWSRLKNLPQSKVLTMQRWRMLSRRGCPLCRQCIGAISLLPIFKRISSSWVSSLYEQKREQAKEAILIYLFLPCQSISCVILPKHRSISLSLSLILLSLLVMEGIGEAKVAQVAALYKSSYTALARSSVGEL